MKSTDCAMESRKRRRLEQLSSQDPYCATCGEADWRTLELHHVAGRKYDDVCAVICRNCHRKLSDDQLGHSASAMDAAPHLISIGHFLLGLADMLRLVAAKLREFGLQLLGSPHVKGIVA